MLLVEVDEPAWSTQVRFLADDIRRRLREESGVEVSTVEVRVRHAGRAPLREREARAGAVVP